MNPGVITSIDPGLQVCGVRPCDLMDRRTWQTHLQGFIVSRSFSAVMTPKLPLALSQLIRQKSTCSEFERFLLKQRTSEGEPLHQFLCVCTERTSDCSSKSLETSQSFHKREEKIPAWALTKNVAVKSIPYPTTVYVGIPVWKPLNRSLTLNSSMFGSCKQEGDALNSAHVLFFHGRLRIDSDSWLMETGRSQRRADEHATASTLDSRRIITPAPAFSPPDRCVEETHHAKQLEMSPDVSPGGQAYWCTSFLCHHVSLSRRTPLIPQPPWITKQSF